MHGSDASAIAGGVSFVLGGCCTNAWSLERLLQGSPAVGTAVTFAQICYIVLRGLPDFVVFKGGVPRLRPLNVPLSTWLIQVVVLTSVLNLNNWAFNYHVPLTLQIVFRSGGLAVSMVLGYFFNNKRYSNLQIFSVILVTLGVMTATILRPTSTKPKTQSSSGLSDAQELYQYAIGVTMLSVASVLTGVQGLLQERTYKGHGKDVWREGVFYTHLLSLPIFCMFHQEVRRGFRIISTPSTSLYPPALQTYPIISSIPFGRIPPLFYILFLNVFSQSFCVAGANFLTSKSSIITSNLVLTIRKAISLWISVWYFDHGINTGFVSGAAMVLFGTLLYMSAGQAPQPPEGKKSTERSSSVTRSPVLRATSPNISVPNGHQILRQRAVKADSG